MDKPIFVAADQALTRLIDAQNYDPTKFAQALAGLPINELKGKDGAIYISLGIVIWDEVASQAEGVQKQEQVKAIITAVRDGIRVGAN
jgi:hypothetical protein